MQCSIPILTGCVVSKKMKRDETNIFIIIIHTDGNRRESTRRANNKIFQATKLVVVLVGDYLFRIYHFPRFKITLRNLSRVIVYITRACTLSLF